MPAVRHSRCRAHFRGTEGLAADAKQLVFVVAALPLDAGSFLAMNLRSILRSAGRGERLLMGDLDAATGPGDARAPGDAAPRADAARAAFDAAAARAWDGVSVSVSPARARVGSSGSEAAAPECDARNGDAAPAATSLAAPRRDPARSGGAKAELAGNHDDLLAASPHPIPPPSSPAHSPIPRRMTPADGMFAAAVEGAHDGSTLLEVSDWTLASSQSATPLRARRSPARGTRSPSPSASALRSLPRSARVAQGELHLRYSSGSEASSDATPSASPRS